MIVNDLKALGEKIKDDDVSHRFLMCLPPRFEIAYHKRTIEGDYP